MLFMLVACHEEPVKDGLVETDTDTDADADSDTDTDADTDTDSAHTGHTGTVATGETGTAACLGIPGDLEGFVEARDLAGAPCAVCAPGTLQLFAGLRNPCPVDITVDVRVNCLVGEFEVGYPNGLGEAAAIECSDGPVPTVIPAGGVLESNYWSVDAGQSGAYALAATLNTAPQVQQVSGGFTVP